MSKTHDTSNLVLYRLDGCPYCARVESWLAERHLRVPMKDWMNEAVRDELKKGGGKTQVPCLRITEHGVDRWLYESQAILEYLAGRLA